MTQEDQAAQPASVEQMARDLLTQAIKDDLVSPAVYLWDDPDPQVRTAGDVVGVANLLAGCLQAAAAEEREAIAASLEEFKTGSPPGTICYWGEALARAIRARANPG